MQMVTPTMIDFLEVCASARSEEIEQYEALTGFDWNVELVVNDLFNKPGIKFALLDGDKAGGQVISVGGWEPIISGVWQAWSVGTMEHWKTHWRSITKFSRRSADLIFAAEGTRRLQIVMLENRKKPCEWCVRGMKFMYESTLRGFGVGGENVAMYVRIKEQSDGNI